MKNFKHLGFKNYLDSYEDRSVWDAPRLIIQIDSLMNLVLQNSKVMNGDAFELHYDMIVLDESESLLSHFDETTMERKEIEIWMFFDELLKQSDKMILLDGDVSQRSLNLASSYGDMIYVNNTNNESNKRLNLICNTVKWEAKLHKDIEDFYKEDPNFRICIASQSSGQALSVEEDLRNRFPFLRIKRLVGMDSGIRKKEYFKDINKTLEDANVFLYSPCVESGVDITIR